MNRNQKLKRILLLVLGFILSPLAIYLAVAFAMLVFELLEPNYKTPAVLAYGIPLTGLLLSYAIVRHFWTKAIHKWWIWIFIYAWWVLQAFLLLAVLFMVP